jgi:hypothetical protein
LRGLTQILICTCFAFCSFQAFAQSSFTVSPEREKQFGIYLATRHGGPEGLAEFRKADSKQYLKELWYFSESFYVERNHLPEGIAFDESAIDITRFEHLRKPNEDAIVIMPGFKDVIVLLAGNKLFYKPDY